VQPVLTLALSVLHLVAAHGWGRAFERTLRLTGNSAAVSTGLGVAVVVVLGGAINVLGLAYAPACWIVSLAGLALNLPMGMDREQREALRDVGAGLVVGLALLVMALVIATVVPGGTFNFHDDFMKYFVFPIRMLQTGSLAGSTLDAMGFETLGGQAWLHGFVLALAPSGFALLNVVDVGIGLPLCVLLLGLHGRQAERPALATLPALAMLFLIDPSVVNVSPTYMGAALLTTLWLLHVEQPPGPASPRGVALATGVLMAALCALKTTYALFCAGFGLAYVVVLLTLGGVRPALRLAGPCVAAVVGCLLPWLLVHRAALLAGSRAPAEPPLPPAAEPYRVDLWSSAEIDYAIGPLPYTLCVISALVLGLLAWRATRNTAQRGIGAISLATAATLGVAYPAMMFLGGPAGWGAGTTLRLFSALLIGTAPALAVIAARRLQGRALGLAVALTLVPLVAFRGTLTTRITQPLLNGSLLAFPTLSNRPFYVSYCQDVLHGPVRDRFARAQAQVPPGQPVLVWAGAPFWLDYARNPTTPYEWAGQVTPWAAVPHVRYVLWEPRGWSVPPLKNYRSDMQANGALRRGAAYGGARLRAVLLEATERAKIYDDGALVVLRLDDPGDLASAYASIGPLDLGL
jgi:hypothetical protein